MNKHRFSNKITCAYLYPITKYGYPPDIRHTMEHIEEMASMGFRSLELEGIGEKNIHYLYDNHEKIAITLKELDCHVPVLCVVLPQLSAVDPAKQAAGLEWFETGCEVAKKLGASAVLDNGPLLPLQYPINAPIQRHYTEESLSEMGLPPQFVWNNYWEDLTSTYRKACDIAKKFNLDYHLHPCEGSLITGTDSFLNFSNAVQRPNLLFNLDTANQFYFKDNLLLSTHRLADRISYIHISDNRGHRVEHLLPGDGKIHWDSFFASLKELKFKGRFAIDIGGAETEIGDIRETFLHCANWLEEKLKIYSLNED